jgi:hypothetical protein
MPLVRRLIKGTDFKRFLDFVTPAFFDVMPARGLFGTATELVRKYRDQAELAEARERRRRTLESSGHPVVLAADRPKSRRDLDQHDEEARRAIGQAALEVYFHQLLEAEGPTLLNLSAERFTHDGERAVWIPGPGTYTWPATFRAALADVYRAFYLEGGKSLEQALEPLDLAPAADIFREHFGAGDQRAVRFEVETFVHAFHQVFLCCKREGIRLDPAFLPLGIYLATLYETLEATGLRLDARGAFERAHEGAGA